MSSCVTTADACTDNDNDEHKSFELIVLSKNKGVKQYNVLMVIVLHAPVNLWSRLLIIHEPAFSDSEREWIYVCSWEMG